MSDDIIIDDEGDLGEGEKTAEAKLKTLRDKLKAEQAESAANLDGWQRAKADYVNLSKRLRELESDVKVSVTRNVVDSLSQLGDSLEAALSHADQAHKVGIDALIKQFDTSLTAIGASRFAPTVGGTFDPLTHEPVQTLATSDQTLDNTIAQVVQSGYKVGEDIVRPARVMVYHHQ